MSDNAKPCPACPRVRHDAHKPCFCSICNGIGLVKEEIVTKTTLNGELVQSTQLVPVDKPENHVKDMRKMVEAQPAAEGTEYSLLTAHLYYHLPGHSDKAYSQAAKAIEFNMTRLEQVAVRKALEGLKEDGFEVNTKDYGNIEVVGFEVIDAAIEATKGKP